MNLVSYLRELRASFTASSYNFNDAEDILSACLIESTLCLESVANCRRDLVRLFWQLKRKKVGLRKGLGWKEDHWIIVLTLFSQYVFITCMCTLFGFGRWHENRLFQLLPVFNNYWYRDSMHRSRLILAVGNKVKKLEKRLSITHQLITPFRTSIALPSNWSLHFLSSSGISSISAVTKWYGIVTWRSLLN